MIRVLIAEDHQETQFIFNRALQRAGFEVCTVQDGAAVVDHLHTKQPDVLILDLHMPILNGIEVLHHIRQSHTLQHLKVILVTADDLILRTSERCMSDKFLIKPILPEQLISAVRALIQT